MSRTRHLLVTFGVAVIIAGGLIGCPGGPGVVSFGGGQVSVADAIELIVDGDLSTGVLDNGAIHWFKFTGTADTEYFIVSKGNAEQVVSIYYEKIDTAEGEGEAAAPTGDSELILVWTTPRQDPSDDYFLLSDEPVTLKRVAIPRFIAPATGTYFVSVEAFTLIQGQNQVQTYAFFSTLSYSIGVATVLNADNALALAVVGPDPAALFTEGRVSFSSNAFYSFAATRGNHYKIEMLSDPASPAPPVAVLLHVDGFTNLGVAGLLTGPLSFEAPLTGTYFIQVPSIAQEWGFEPFRLRVLSDQFADAATGEATVLQTGTTSGFLSLRDIDVLEFSAAPHATFRASLDDKTDLVLTSNGTGGTEAGVFVFKNFGGEEAIVSPLEIEMEGDLGNFLTSAYSLTIVADDHADADAVAAADPTAPVSTPVTPGTTATGTVWALDNPAGTFDTDVFHFTAAAGATYVITVAQTGETGAGVTRTVTVLDAGANDEFTNSGAASVTAFITVTANAEANYELSVTQK